MLPVSAAYRTAYDQSQTLKALPKVIIEWDQNRYAASVSASNAGRADVEPVNFPITSIIEANRPTRGLIKARVGEARAVGRGSTTQYKTVGPDASYKYWTSPTESDVYGDITLVNPSVVYSSNVSTNKILIGIETSWAKPSSYTVDISFDGSTWQTIATNPTINADGQIILYRQSSGAWTTTEADFPINIRGIRLNVSKMNRGNAHLNLITISARLRKDISSDVISLNVDKSSDDASLIFPLGELSANTANVELDNSTARYDAENTSSPYYGLIDENAEVYISLGTLVNGAYEYVPQGVFYVDSWNLDSDNGTVSIASSDYAKFLQSEQMSPVLFQGKTSGQMIAQILTSVGFNKISLVVGAGDPDTFIPYVWFNEETNVWEAIKSICNATQSTAFFDEYGNFKYVSRNTRYLNTTSPDTTLNAVNSGATLANLADIQQDFNVEANKIVVNYKPYIANSRQVPVDKITVIPALTSITHLRGRQAEQHYSEDRVIKTREYDNIPIDSVLWKPEDTVTLRAEAMQRPLTETTDSVYVPGQRSVTWPFSGYLNVEGEIMFYDGKEYRYFVNGVATYAIIKSADEQRRIDDLVSDLSTSYRNAYTGRLANVKRGQMGTKAVAHSIDIASWQCWRKNSNQTVDSTPVRMTQKESQMILWGYSGDNNETYTMAHRGLFQDRYRVYGTKIKFARSGYTQGTAGMYWSMQSDRKQAYYVELNLTSHAVNTMKGAIKNVRVYRMMSDGSRRALPNVTADAKGKDYNIVPDQWVSIDVTYEPGTGGHNIYIDGKLMSSFVDPNGLLPAGTWGPFIRGYTVASFEYFYTHNSSTTPNIEETTFMNKLTGSFASGYADREVSRNGKTVNWYMDDFGPWVHEVREFDVKFDKFPALDANIFMSNDWGCYLMGSNNTPFGAKFWLANASRGNATINGDDPLTINGSEVKQALIVYGQLILEDETKTLTVKNDISNDELENAVVTKNDSAIRRRGVVELTFDSDWIQSKTQAQALGDFLTAHWSEPVDNITAEGFFSPAIQPGDLVAINFPSRSMTPSTHRYYVIGVTLGFDGGIKTSLKLRRVR